MSTDEIARLEQEGQLLRVLRTDLKEHIEHVLNVSPNKAHPFVTVSGEQVYLSFASLHTKEQRQEAHELLRRCQLGADVDLSRLPPDLQQLIQPACTQPQRLLRSLLIAVILGIVIGVLAMAITVLVISALKSILHVSLDELGGVRITAVSFVLFAVLGWMGSAVYFWRRIQAYHLQ